MTETTYAGLHCRTERRDVATAGLWSRLRRARRGSVTTVFGAATPMLIGVMGLAIDTTYWETSKVKLQSAADMAVVAAGRAYKSGENITTEAVAVLAENGLRPELVTAELARREGLSGLAEKAGRTEK